MLTSIRLQSFKGHRDTTVRLGRLTLLVGPNGSGKTSVLQGIRALSQLLIGPSDAFDNELNPVDIRRRNSQGIITLSAHGIDGEIPWQFTIEIDTNKPTKNALPWSITSTWSYGDQRSGSERNPMPPALECSFGDTALYYFDA